MEQELIFLERSWHKQYSTTSTAVDTGFSNWKPLDGYSEGPQLIYTSSGNHTFHQKRMATEKIKGQINFAQIFGDFKNETGSRNFENPGEMQLGIGYGGLPEAILRILQP